MDDYVQVLLVTFPAQGHINPSLQFAKRLVKMGVEVTLLTPFSALYRMTNSGNTPQGLTFSGFSDGHDDGAVHFEDGYMDRLKIRGTEAVTKLITSGEEMGKPFNHVVYTTLITWAGHVARAHRVPSSFLWIQPATILDIYYYYFNGYGDSIGNNMNDSSWSVELPGLPLLMGSDLPSFMLASNVYKAALPAMKEHLDIIDSEVKVLVNSFDCLEFSALKAIEKLNLVAVGPLIPSAFVDGKDSSDTSFGGDLFHQNSKAYMDWMNTKSNRSVIYVAFGSFSSITEQQMEEIERGLLDCGRPFLWVVRATEGNKLSSSNKEKLEQQGMIVSWCSQVEVLSHSSVGCFVTHCGWNSSLESLVCGVPTVAFPQWSDQVTNAKLIEDVWKTGTRLKRNQGGVVIKSEEIKKCIEVVMGSDEMRKNAEKWKDLAREAVKEGGSSYNNLNSFVDEVRASRVK